MVLLRKDNIITIPEQKIRETSRLESDSGAKLFVYYRMTNWNAITVVKNFVASQIAMDSSPVKKSCKLGEWTRVGEIDLGKICSASMENICLMARKVLQHFRQPHFSFVGLLRQMYALQNNCR